MHGLLADVVLHSASDAFIPLSLHTSLDIYQEKVSLSHLLWKAEDRYKPLAISIWDLERFCDLHEIMARYHAAQGGVFRLYREAYLSAVLFQLRDPREEEKSNWQSIEALARLVSSPLDNGLSGPEKRIVFSQVENGLRTRTGYGMNMRLPSCDSGTAG